MKAAVVGAGISGLTCAVVLQEAGLAVRVLARDPPARTTSAVGAAIWLPYEAGPPDRVLAWGAASYRTFAELARSAASAVSMLEVRALAMHPATPPPWHRHVQGFRELAPAEVPAGYAGGTAFLAPLAEMPAYLHALEARLCARGGEVVHAELRSLSEAFDGADLVVNCAGLGARELVPDPEMFAIRGQVARVRGAGVPHALVDEHGPRGLAYVIPRRGDIVLGGTAERGVESLAPDPAQRAALRARCEALLPQLRRAEHLGDDVGLRPGRPAVRLELERTPRGPLIHDYGHGGCGMTLSWGCAEEVARLAAAARG